MLVLLSPSKKMDFSDSGKSKFQTLPKFEAEANYIMDSLTEYKADELEKILKCSKELAANALKMAYDFNGEVSTKGVSALSFNGVAFKELDAKNWNDDDISYAQKYLRIGSAVYGILRPFDLIKPYRLDLLDKITLNDNNVSLQKYWKRKVSLSLLSDLKFSENTLINCSSDETFDMLDKELLKNIRIIQARFLIYSNIGLKSAPTVFVKKARGALANFIIKNKVNSIDDFHNFNSINMHFSSTLSDNENAIFLFEK